METKYHHREEERFYLFPNSFRGTKQRLMAAFLLSAFVHLAALLLFSLPASQAALPPQRIVEVLPLPPPQPEPKPPEVQKPPEENPSGQIVDLGPPQPTDPSTPPSNTPYLSERNMRTERESVKPSRARTGSPGRKSAVKSKRQSKAEKAPSADKKEKESSKTAKKDSPAPDLPQKETPVQVARREKGGKEEVTREKLKVTMSDLEESLEADDGSIDYLPRVPRGDITVLNSKQYTYAAFFNRMKKTIRFHWDYATALRTIGNPNIRISATFWIVINRNGEVVSIETIKSSPYPIWDAQAIKAVRRAAPFYNVPEGLLDENGLCGSKWTFLTY